MIAITISITDQNPHSLWSVITGQDTTGVSASKTYPGWKTGQTGSFWDMNFIAADDNSGMIVLGDGSVGASDPGLLNGATKMYPGKTSALGLYFLSTTGAGGDTEVLRVELPMGGVG